MCIRDRTSLNRFAGDERQNRLRRILVGVLDGAWRPLLGRCLLYTSDAADERSSVDLGGRRIIKKKITADYSRRLHTHIAHTFRPTHGPH